MAIERLNTQLLANIDFYVSMVFREMGEQC